MATIVKKQTSDIRNTVVLLVCLFVLSMAVVWGMGLVNEFQTAQQRAQSGIATWSASFEATAAAQR